MDSKTLRKRLSSLLRDLANWLMPRDPAAPPDPDLLDRLVEHVAHEMAAMAAAGNLWENTNLWIALEDFLLHARVLREFYWETWDPTDRFASSAVAAEHYNLKWRGTSGGPPECFRRTKNAVDKQLAHITRERITDPMDLAREVKPMTTELWKAWERFLRGLGSDPRADTFRSILKERCESLEVKPPDGAI